jgi:hypothetical protein
MNLMKLVQSVAGILAYISRYLKPKLAGILAYISRYLKPTFLSKKKAPYERGFKLLQ